MDLDTAVARMNKISDAVGDPATLKQRLEFAAGLAEQVKTLNLLVSTLTRRIAPILSEYEAHMQREAAREREQQHAANHPVRRITIDGGEGMVCFQIGDTVVRKIPEGQDIGGGVAAGSASDEQLWRYFDDNTPPEGTGAQNDASPAG